MNELIAKLSSYNFINYLLPGAIFIILVSEITKYNFIHNDLFVGFVIYYFCGLLMSRVGSLIIEPVLQSIKFIQYSEYKKFQLAEQKDSKIHVLLEQNNFYRSLVATILCVVLVRLYEILMIYFNSINYITPYMLLVIVFALFLFSYQKQTNYIKKRIDNIKDI